MDVAVVNYNTRKLLLRCLHSIRGQASLGRIVVSDDGSSDGSVEAVRARFPQVELVTSVNNRGFGAAANAAIDRCSSSDVLLVNSDTLLQSDVLHSLGEYLEKHEQAAIVGPRLLNADGTLQHSCFPFPSPSTALLGETGIGYFIRFIPLLRSRHLRTWPHDRPRRVPWVRGAALAIRKEPFLAVGGFDPGFFMYFEEVDLAYRLQRAGWEVHFAPVADVHHVGGASTELMRAEMRIRYYKSMSEFYRRYLPPWHRSTLHGILRMTKGVAFARDRIRLAIARNPESRERLRADLEAWQRILLEL